MNRISINPANFAVNNRMDGYDPTSTLYNTPGPYSLTPPAGTSTLSTQTLTGDISYYYENAVVGKAAYGLLLEGLPGNG